MKIYCDLDGVLVDFDGEIYRRASNQILNPSNKIEKDLKNFLNNKKLHKNVFNKDTCPNPIFQEYLFQICRNNAKFWSNLFWKQDGKKLWNYIKQYNPIILSAPVDKECEEGKKIWIKKNLNIENERIILDKEKWKYAEESILIDDLKSNIDLWIKNGGIGVLHRNSLETIKILKNTVLYNSPLKKHIQFQCTN